MRKFTACLYQQNKDEIGKEDEVLYGVSGSLLQRGRLSSVAIERLEQLHVEGDVVVSAALDVFRIGKSNLREDILWK